MVAERPTMDMAARLQTYLAGQNVADPQVDELRQLTNNSTHKT